MKRYATSDRNILDKYVGTDLWVNVRTWYRITEEYLYWYAKFLDIRGPYYLVILIPEKDVDSGVLYNLDHMDHWATWTPRQDIKLIEPIEVLTNEEIFELWVPHGGEE